MITIGTLEQALLCRCARRPHAADAQRTDALARSSIGDDRPIDWDAFLAMAELHGVSELLLPRLTREWPGVPPAVVQDLENRRIDATALTLRRTKQLADLLRRFESNGIRALAFKGPALAAAVYGHLGLLRLSSDLDVLVDRRHALRVRPLMLANGYTLPPRTRHRTGSLLAGLYPRAGRDDVFRPARPELAIVEVHAAFAYWTQGIRLDTAALFDRAMTVDVAGTRIPTLCADDYLLVLAIHGMMHGWCCLRFVSDIDAVTHHVRDWDAVVARAEAARMRRTLWVAILLARDLLETRVPPDVLARAEHDRDAVNIATGAAARLFDAEAQAQDWDPYPWFLAFHERSSDRRRFQMRTLIYEWFLKWPWDEWLGRRTPPPDTLRGT